MSLCRCVDVTVDSEIMANDVSFRSELKRNYAKKIQRGRSYMYIATIFEDVKIETPKDQRRDE